MKNTHPNEEVISVAMETDSYRLVNTKGGLTGWIKQLSSTDTVCYIYSLQKSHLFVNGTRWQELNVLH